MALLLERSFINFPKCYKFIIIVILLMVHNQATTSSEVNLKDSVYFGNSRNKFDYISDVIRRYKRQNVNSGVNCELPSNPLHGRYAILGDSATSYKPADFANEFTYLEIHCKRGYAISPLERNLSICINGTWLPQLTACLRTCPSLNSTETTTVKCRLNNIPLNNCLNPVMGTKAVLSCNPLYEEHSLQRSPIRVCKANGWNPSTSTCYPICGNKNTKGNPNIISGHNATIGDYPWQIGIYNSTTKAFICGGSIIEQNIILTAAHCVTDYEGHVQPAGEYSVTAGKYFSRYDEPRDLFAQYSNVLSIHVPDRYTGRINAFAQDIAVLILEIHFTLSKGVQPICIALNDDLSDLNFLAASDIGIVTGWGYTIGNGDVADVLKELSIPLIPFHKCSSEVPERFRKFYTADKICGGYLNNRTSICKGDSGGALVLKNLIDNRYYVRGIVSTSPASEEITCDSNQYSLYTSIDQHIDFVRDLVTDNQFRTPIECSTDSCQNEENPIEYKQGTTSRTPIECSADSCQNEENPIENKQGTTSTHCQIPNYGSHVRYTILRDSGNAYQIPGDDVQQDSILEIICDQGYKPNVFSDLRTICLNGKWSPSLALRCLRTCPSLNSTTSTRVTCKYRDIPLKSCYDPIEETTALLLCNPLYEEDSLQKNIIRTCTAGRWIPAISECHPMCGVKRPKGRPNIINGQDATMGDYPWQVGIYDHQKTFLCGGSILDRHIILTGARCVTYLRDGQFKPFEIYNVAAGKYYSKYDDERDKFAQYSKILQVHIPKRYRGLSPALADDISIIVLTDPFIISETVQPVCIELNKELPSMHLSLNSSGIITGWGYPTDHPAKVEDISEVLKELVVPIIPFYQCFEEITKIFQKFLTDDKICAGYLNNGSSNCLLDEGGALVLINSSSERYYVEGILSLVQITDRLPCNSNQYSLYTSIKEHIDFIKNVLDQHQIPQSIEFVAEEATN